MPFLKREHIFREIELELESIGDKMTHLEESRYNIISLEGIHFVSFNFRDGVKKT